jgi:hypothetical protein
VDFFSIYEAGHRALANESLYEFKVFELARAPYSAPYRYVPGFAYTVGASANVLRPWWAFWAWVSLNELMLCINAYGTWRVSRRTSWGVVAAAMWFVFFPFYLEVYKGQFTFLMATALFWTGIGIVYRQQATAAVPWAVSLVTKSTSALLAPLFLRLGWMYSLAGAVVLAVVNGLYFVWRPDDWTLFREKNAGFLTDANRGFAHPWPGDHGGLALLENTLRTFDFTMRSSYTLTLAVLVIGLSVCATLLSKKADPLAAFGILIGVFFLFFGFVWEFHYVMLLPPLTLLVALRPAARPWAVAAFVLLAAPTPYWLLNNVWNEGPIPQGFELLGVQNSWPAWGIIVYHAQKPAATLLLWIYLVATQLHGGFSFAWVSALLNRSTYPAGGNPESI